MQPISGVSLRRDERGSVVMEFALLAPVLFILMFGIVEYGIIMLANNTLEHATTKASRLGKTGYTVSGVSRQTMIYNMIKNDSLALVNPDHVTITTRAYKKIDQIGDPEPYTDSNHNNQYNTGEPYTDVNGNGRWDADMGLAGLGGAGDVVVYTVTYPWHVMTPIVSHMIGENGIFTISSTMVVRNEPYDY